MEVLDILSNGTHVTEDFSVLDDYYKILKTVRHTPEVQIILSDGRGPKDLCWKVESLVEPELWLGAFSTLKEANVFCNYVGLNVNTVQGLQGELFDINKQLSLNNLRGEELLNV